MRSICRAGLVLTVVCALGAVTASSAFAGEEWATKSGGVFSKVTSPLEVTGTTNITVLDPGFSAKVVCEGTTSDTIEAGGVGKINSYTVTNCNREAGCGTLLAVESVNLPWKTELYREHPTEAPRERIVSGGSGTPGWKFACKGTSVTREDLCNFNTSAKMENMGTPNVRATFEEKSNVTHCTQGGEDGRLQGTIMFAPPKGYEAVRVGEHESEWLEGEGEWRQAGASLKESLATTWSGKLVLADQTLGVTSECEATGEGTAELWAAGSETKWTVSGCTVTVGKGLCPSVESVEAVNLPWHTELVDSAGAKYNVITSKGGGEVGFTRKCHTALGKSTDTCTAKKLETDMANVAGGVNATFDSKAFEGEALHCTLSGGSGAAEGTQLVEAVKGGKLEVK